MFTLILGGARSGKSELATKLADASGRDVLFVATMREFDEEVRARVAVHRAKRPAGWRTVEAPIELTAALREHSRRGEFVVIDCVTVWIANLIMDALPDPDAAPIDAVDRVTEFIDRQVTDLSNWAVAFEGNIAVVSNDVGSGVVPAYRLGRIFRDAAGAANKALAAAAGRSYYMIAGMALDLRASGALPIDAVVNEPQ
jgi:adenosylcobinamide kinase/adenosylcobinamide-phosphate guanylyltransferase